MIETFISSIFVGTSQAYIYIWISKIHKVIYVGMTNARVGTLGRSSSHLNHKGTLRKNFEDLRGYSIDLTNDFKLLSFPLPQKKEYISVERSYREAIEYLVQKNLIVLRGTLISNMDIISWVRPSPRMGNSEVKSIANSIIAQFSAAYPSL